MINEYVFVMLTILDLLGVFFAARLGREALHISIVLNIILISAFGAKLITFFGITTNTGNSFFACVFVATYLMSELWGKQEALKSVLFGLLSLVFFILMGQFVINFKGVESTSSVSQALEIIYARSARVALASILSYIVVQYINVTLYNYLKQKTAGRLLYMRSMIATLIGQGLDSALFFSLAFYGIVPNSILLQSMVSGFLIKSTIGFVATPFLYLSYLIDTPKDKDEHE